MDSSNLAENYGLALFNSARDAKQRSLIQKDMELLKNLLDGDQMLQKIISSPVIKHEEKLKAARVIAEQYKMQDVTKRFLELVIEKGRGGYLKNICDYYQAIVCKQDDITSIEVTSARLMKKADQEQLTKQLEKEFSKKLIINFQVDEKLIAGLVIKYNSIIRDYSILGAIKKIETEMISA